MLGTRLGAKICSSASFLWDNDSLKGKEKVVCILQAQTLRYIQLVWPWRMSIWRDVGEYIPAYP